MAERKVEFFLGENVSGLWKKIDDFINSPTFNRKLVNVSLTARSKDYAYPLVATVVYDQGEQHENH